MNCYPITKIQFGNNGSNSNVKRIHHSITLESHTLVRDIKPCTPMVQRLSFTLFIPYASKGPKGPTCTIIKDAFLCTAAMLLIIPKCYQYIIKQLGLTILPNHCAKIYNATIFGNKYHLSKNEMACFLISVGVTTNEAESWRP